MIVQVRQHITLMPVFVAALTASSSLSYFGLNATVKALSMTWPAKTYNSRFFSCTI
jgi:hypothetical protein